MAFVYPTSWKIEAELAGVGGGWTDLSQDVRQTQPIKWRYGIDGNELTDRVATIGTLTFALNNGEWNSGGKLGYYAADSPNLRAGFQTGINVRFSVVYGGVRFYKFFGRLKSFDPLPGRYDARTTACIVVDYMDELSRTNIKRLAIQMGKRADEILLTMVTAMARQPVSTTFGVGKETYPFALDGSQDEGTSALTECQKIAQSEVGYIYPRGNTTGGGELVFESRTDRAAKNTTIFTFDDTMLTPGSLDVTRDRDFIVNRLQAVGHPKRQDTSDQTLYTLRDTSVSTDTVITLGPSETKTFVAPFTNSANQEQRIGASSIVVPVATTDYTFNSAPDGSGADLTASLGVLVTASANTAFVTITNTSATATGYVTKFNIRGRGIYDQQQFVAEKTDAASIDAQGENNLTFDMPYQSDPDVVTGAAQYFLALLKDAQTKINGFGVLANKSDALMTQALMREPGDRIAIGETATGLSNSGQFIQSCEGTLEGGGILKMTFGVAPASRQDFWLVGVVGASELGQTTYVGF